MPEWSFLFGDLFPWAVLVGGLALSLGLASLPDSLHLPVWLTPFLHSLGLLAVGLAVGYLILPLLRSEPVDSRLCVAVAQVAGECRPDGGGHWRLDGRRSGLLCADCPPPMG